MMTIYCLLLSPLVLWLLFVFSMNWLKVYEDGHMTAFGWIGAPFVAVGWVLDFLLNFTLFALLLMSYPNMPWWSNDPSELTFSKHINRCKLRPGILGWWARFISAQALHPFDPTGRH